MNMFAVYDNAEPDTENIIALNLGVVQLTTVEVNKLPLWHKISKIDMISSAKPVLTENSYIVLKEEYLTTCDKYN
jgi:hypothetical protein